MQRRNFLRSIVTGALAAVSFAVPAIALAKPKSLRHPDAKYWVQRVEYVINKPGKWVAVPISVYETFENQRGFNHSVPSSAFTSSPSGLFYISDEAERFAAMTDDELIDLALQHTKDLWKDAPRDEYYFDFDNRASIRYIS